MHPAFLRTVKWIEHNHFNLMIQMTNYHFVKICHDFISFIVSIWKTVFKHQTNNLAKSDAKLMPTNWFLQIFIKLKYDCINQIKLLNKRYIFHTIRRMRKNSWKNSIWSVIIIIKTYFSLLIEFVNDVCLKELLKIFNLLVDMQKIRFMIPDIRIVQS